jgi:cytochrome P450
MPAAALDESLLLDPHKAINIGSEHFTEHKYEYYRHFREHMPVAPGKIAMMKVHLVSRYDDCLALTKDPRFGRNRSNITGGSRMPFPLPKSIALIALSMIVEDDPEHRRLRNLVQKAFAPKSLARLQAGMQSMAHDLMDQALAAGQVDLQQAYALQIPSAVIARMVGIADDDMPEFQNSLRVLSSGFTGWNVFRTVAWDLRKATAFMRKLIENKRSNPGDDILSQLIEAEEEGDRLSEDEIVSMLFLLIVAGFETTVHLISNGVVALLDHPEELQRLREDAQLMGSAVEEILRYCPPVHGTKMNFAREDLEIAGVPIAKGEIAIPLLACANRDAAAFPDPDMFNITRDPNRHLSFSQGNHFCLGAFLARMEAKIALQVLLERSPDLRLAIPRDQLKVQKMPLWQRYDGLPVHVA